MVTLFVGPERAQFLVHKDVICQVSDFFTKAFNSEFSEAKTASMDLPEEDPNLFEVFVRWLYHPLIEDAKETHPDAEKKSHTLLVRLYLLADKYSIVTLKRSIIDHLVFYIRLNPAGIYAPSLHDLSKIYENAPASSGLRKLFLDWFKWGINLDFWKAKNSNDKLKDMPEVAADLVCAYAARIQADSNGSKLWRQKIAAADYYDKE